MIFVLDFNPDPALIHDRLKTEEMARLGRFERPTSGSGDQRRLCMLLIRLAQSCTVVALLAGCSAGFGP